MKYFVRPAAEKDQLEIVDMSKDWEAEGCTYGFHADKLEYIKENRCWVACDDGEIAGYIFGKVVPAKNMKSIMPEGTPYFEIEELYVKPAYRNQGIGSALMDYLESILINEDVKRIVLSTATKDYESILNFYINVY